VHVTPAEQKAEEKLIETAEQPTNWWSTVTAADLAKTLQYSKQLNEELRQLSEEPAKQMRDLMQQLSEEPAKTMRELNEANQRALEALKFYALPLKVP